jgi:hypothetical protein
MNHSFVFMEKTIQFFCLLFFLASCGAIKQSSWRLEKAGDYDVGHQPAKTKNLDSTAWIGPNEQEFDRTLALASPESVVFDNILQEVKTHQKIASRQTSVMLNQPVLDIQTKEPLTPAQQLRKYEKAFKRQVVWYSIFTAISVLLTIGAFDQFAMLYAALLFALIPVAGIVAIVLAAIMKKRSRILKEQYQSGLPDTIPSDADQQMKRLKLWRWIGLSGLSLVVIIGVGLILSF